MDLNEPAVPRPMTEIVNNLYLTAPPHWQLDGSKEREIEDIKGTIEYEKRTVRDSQELESDFSDMSDDEDAPAPSRNLVPLTVKWTRAANSTCKAIPENYCTSTGLKCEDVEDISMTAPLGQETTKKEGACLNTSKHAIPKADKALVEQAVKEAIHEAERIFNEKMK